MDRGEMWGTSRRSLSEKERQRFVMLTQDIPPNEWAAYLSSLSRQYWGRLITIEVCDGGIGIQVKVGGLFLKNISANVAEGGRPMISIAAQGQEEQDAQSITRSKQVIIEITTPLQVMLEQALESPAVLKIVSQGGLTIVRFCSAPVKMMIDGVAIETLSWM
jgi:hypothetical protein